MKPWFAALAVAALAAVPTPAAAQLSATPAIVRFGEGGTAGDVALVRVRNESASPAQYRIYLGDYDQSEDGDFRFTGFGAGRGSCAGALSVFPDAAVLEPGEVQELRVRLEPAGAACWAVLFVETATSTTGQVRVAQRIGVRIVHSPPGSEPDGMVTDVVAAVHGDSLAVTVGFENAGTVPVELKGIVEVRSLADGELLRRGEIAPLGVLPSNRRRIPVRLANDLPPGRYLVVPILDLGADFLVGGQAELTVR